MRYNDISYLMITMSQKSEKHGKIHQKLLYFLLLLLNTVYKIVGNSYSHMLLSFCFKFYVFYYPII